LVIATTHADFIDKLKDNLIDSAWIISGENSVKADANFVNAVEAFHKSGRGIAFWADNEPWYGDVNPVTQRLIKLSLTGNTPAGKTLAVGDGKAKGTFGRHLITSGISNLFEGITICYPTGQFAGTTLAHSTDGNPCILYSDYDHIPSTSGRIIVDTGFTKLYNSWDTAGTERYVRNVAVWLLALDHRLKMGYNLQGPITST